MAGTEAGGMKTAKANRERHGQDYYKRLGSIGGKANTGYPFAHGKITPQEASRLGLEVRRKKSKEI